MHDQFMEMLKERDEDGSCIVGGLNYAGEAYDRLQAQADEIERLREALRDLVIAVEYNGPPIDFGDGNLCWEARIPIGFIDDARSALEEKE